VRMPQHAYAQPAGTAHCGRRRRRLGVRLWRHGTRRAVAVSAAESGPGEVAALGGGTRRGRASGQPAQLESEGGAAAVSHLIGGRPIQAPGSATTPVLAVRLEVERAADRSPSRNGQSSAVQRWGAVT